MSTLATISRRGSRFITKRYLQSSIHTYRVSPLLNLVHTPRLRHPYVFKQQNLTRQVHGRAISFFSAPKILAKFARVPAAAGGAVVAGIAYVNYQVQGMLFD